MLQTVEVKYQRALNSLSPISSIFWLKSFIIFYPSTAIVTIPNSFHLLSLRKKTSFPVVKTKDQNTIDCSNIYFWRLYQDILTLDFSIHFVFSSTKVVCYFSKICFIRTSWMTFVEVYTRLLSLKTLTALLHFLLHYLSSRFSKWCYDVIYFNVQFLVHFQIFLLFQYF